MPTPPWHQHRPPELTADTRLGGWCWTWKGWARWWQVGPAIAAKPERGRINAHVAIPGSWTVYRHRGAIDRRGGAQFPWWWSVCGAKVAPGPPHRRYVRRCERCAAVVGPAWWPRRRPLPVTPNERARRRAIRQLKKGGRKA